jgi:peptidoglycan/xylan/chitin deacetylase (PgdA/CDA1 family)
MPLTKRRQLRAARTLAAAATVLLPGRPRAAAWALHEILRLAPTLLRNCDWHGPVAKRFQPEGREVWLTIDDGPDPDQTPGMLDLLASAGARASFFVVGEKVDWNRALCRRIVAEGHSLENHTYSHPSALFWTLPCCAIRAEIVRCNHAIRVAAGTSPTWFRSPVGMTNPCVHPAAARSWLRLAGWSDDGLDGLPWRDPAKAAARILRGVSPGSIILLHDGAPGRRSAECLEILLHGLAADGYRCVIPAGSRIF